MRSRLRSGFWFLVSGFLVSVFGRPGGDRLSRVLRRSTMGAEGFHGRVRDGIGCGPLAITTRSSKDRLRPRTDFVRGRSAGPGTGLGCNWTCMRGIAAARGSPGQAPKRLPERARIKPIERLVPVGSSALPRFHLRPIDVMVCHGSRARPGFEGGFPLRCFQRLSRPHIATRRCRWRDNRYTRGASIPVLSY